jgi:ATP-dependent protease HslVU (ClpYQ) peptidase subunit
MRGSMRQKNLTIVVAAKHNGRTIIGADTCTTVGHKKLTNMLNNSKLVRFNSFIVGMSGIGPTREVLDRMILEVTPAEEDENGVIIKESKHWFEHVISNTVDVATFIEHFFELYQERGEADEMASVELLFITEDKIFCTMGECAVFEVQDFWAVGAGADFAVGALDILFPASNSDESWLYDTVRGALETACKYADGCQPPLEILYYSKD